MNNAQKPLARRENLVVQEMPGETLVFDTETNKAHCLNETAAFVWKACDGKNSIADIAQSFGSQSKTTVQEDLIWLAIDQLNDNNLLAKELKANFNGQTRRDVIKKIGLAAVVGLPLVASLAAPSAVLAVGCSGIIVNTSDCGSNLNCSCSPCTTGGTTGPGTCIGMGACQCPTSPRISDDTKSFEK